MYCSTAAVTVLNLSGGPCHAAVGVGLVNNGRDELEIPVKAKYDGEYAKNLGLKMDVKCFLGFLHFFGKDDSVVEGGTGEMKKKEKVR